MKLKHLPMLRRTLTILVIVTLILQCFKINPAYSAFNISNATDQIQSVQLGLAHIEHEVQFTAPVGSNINVTDYISLVMTNYSSIDISRLTITGSFVFGDQSGAHITLTGNTVQITNLSVISGNTLQINGIRATNPQVADQFTEMLYISTDQAIQNIKNSATIEPNLFNGQVITSATILPFASQITLEGFTAPGTFITVSEAGSVLATGSPDGTGAFQILLTGLNPGLHSLSLYGIDANANTTATTILSSVYLPAYQNTTVSNIILSPIISLQQSQIQQGDPLTITGETVPNSNVTISINSPLEQFSTTSDASGNFTYTDTQTSTLDPGVYDVSAVAQTQNNLISISSPAQEFTVLSGNPVQNNGPGCDISKGDLNCDHQVDILDFSILMYYWGTGSALADINNDGAVDLLDFSIMMFYFGTSV